MDNQTQIAKQRLQALTPEYQEFVKSDFSSEAAQAFGQKAGFSNEQIVILDNAIVLYLLFFFDLPQMTQFIERECDITNEAAAEIAYALQAALPPGYETMHAAAYTAFNNETAPPASSSAEASEHERLAADIEAEEAALKTRPSIRTMPEDAERSRTANQPQNAEPVHQSSQESLLQRDEQQTQAKTEIPRWGNQE